MWVGNVYCLGVENGVRNKHVNYPTQWKCMRNCGVWVTCSQYNYQCVHFTSYFLQKISSYFLLLYLLWNLFNILDASVFDFFRNATAIEFFFNCFIPSSFDRTYEMFILCSVHTINAKNSLHLVNIMLKYLNEINVC